MGAVSAGKLSRMSDDTAENATEREERAERLRRIQERIHEQTGGPQTSEQVAEACRRVIKGK